jgi:uncharacterized membrane protein YcaP (DUF421 family)
MSEYFNSTSEGLLAIVLSTLGIYIAVIVYTRIFGKRSLSKMSSFDFAMTVAVGSLIATTALSKSVSLLDGLVGLLAIYSFQLIVAYCRRWASVRKAIDNRPLLLMSGPKILEKNLRKARLSEGDLRSKLREANVMNLNEIRAVVFETTGDIIVMHSKNPDQNLSQWMLQDVTS